MVIKYQERILNLVCLDKSESFVEVLRKHTCSDRDISLWNTPIWTLIDYSQYGKRCLSTIILAIHKIQIHSFGSFWTLLHWGLLWRNLPTVLHFHYCNIQISIESTMTSHFIINYTFSAESWYKSWTRISLVISQ